MAPPEPGETAAAPSLFVSLANGQGRVAIVCVTLLAALAWWWLIFAQPMGSVPSDSMADMPDMPGMAMPPALSPWSAGYLGATATMWAVMMVAMMLPSAAPMIALHQVFAVKRGLGSAGTLAFAGSYLALWLGFALGAALLQAFLVAQGWVGQASLRLGSGRMAAIVLGAAGLYQLSALKQRCLIACQAPFAFLLRYWRPGVVGGWAMGLRHGLFCIGCCGALMALLFVGGVMNLAWIAALTALVLAEKYAPPAWLLDRISAVLLLAGAAALALQA